MCIPVVTAAFFSAAKIQKQTKRLINERIYKENVVCVSVCTHSQWNIIQYLEIKKSMDKAGRYYAEVK
jgi:hypothetical protein